jgi:hypothetical protein
MDRARHILVYILGSMERYNRCLDSLEAAMMLHVCCSRYSDQEISRKGQDQRRRGHENLYFWRSLACVIGHSETASINPK